MKDLKGAKDLKTRGIVLRRTNYGETDRILNFLTPEGKVAVLAKGVRKEKSKLAGGVELFAVTQMTVHFGKTSLATLTSARMEKFFRGVLGDLAKLELAGKFLKRVEKIAEQTDNAEFFEILEQSLEGLNVGVDMRLTEMWFDLNLARASGEEVNLYVDTEGRKLDAEKRYLWDFGEEAMKEQEGGVIGANEIKLLRLMLATKLETVARVEGAGEMLAAIEPVARSFRK